MDARGESNRPDGVPGGPSVSAAPLEPARPSVVERVRGALDRARAAGPPPGPARPGFWRSPLRGPWLTGLFGLVLLVGVIVLFVTGLLSYAAYNPDLAARNDQTPDKGWLGFYLFTWPTSPYWLYRLTQGVHTVLGVVLVPVLLAKLWSVIPKLFAWPPLRSVGHALERLSLLLLVGGAGFTFVTGILNIQLDYISPAPSTPSTSTAPGCSSPPSSSTSPPACPGRCGRCGPAGISNPHPSRRRLPDWSRPVQRPRRSRAGARSRWWGPARWPCSR